jgi:predicted dehydrogenase
VDKIKVGVIGIGFIGAAHIEALEELDAVHICTPNNLHHPQTRDALAAGKHVLCEKPLAVTVKEARDLVKRAIPVNPVL